MKKVFEVTTTKTTYRTVNIEEIEGTDFVYYEDVRSINEDGNFYVKRYKGITSKENVNEYKLKGLDFINDTVKSPKMYEKKAMVAAIDREDFEHVIHGYKHITDVIQYLKDIDDFMNNEKYILVLWNWMSNKIADLNYNFISIPISFGYIDGAVDNFYYDLNKLLNKLKKDPNVCNKENLKISDIPYYNCDYEDGRTKSIEFKYLLPYDIYDEIMSKNLASNTIRNYILKEVIGAEECRIKRKDLYECF